MRSETVQFILAHVGRYPGEYAKPILYSVRLHSGGAPIVGRLEFADCCMVVQGERETTFIDCADVAAISLARSADEIAREATMLRT
jgi:hypothetical protein